MVVIAMKREDVKEGMLVMVVDCSVEMFNGVIGVVDGRHRVSSGRMFWIVPKFVPKSVPIVSFRGLSPMLFYCASFEPLDPGIAALYGVDAT